MTRTKEIAIGILLVALLVVAVSLVEAREDRVRMEATLTAQREVIAAKAADVAARDRAALASEAAIEALKARTVTPAQIIRELPQVIQLPTPLVQAPAVAPDMDLHPIEGGEAVYPTKQNTGGADAVELPAEDLKPLFDKLAGCKADETRLAACEADATDHAAQMKAVETERDAAVKAARGGGWWVRTKRAAKWLGVGVVVGLVASRGAK